MRRKFRQRVRNFNGIFDLADMNQTVAVSTWHVRIDLRYDVVGHMNRRARHVYGNAERAKAMAVGW